MEWFLPVAYLLAFLANAAVSVFWGVRYKRANDQLVAAKNAQIETLRELTSTKVLEHFRDTKAVLEDSIRTKEEEIRELKNDHISREQLIHKFQKTKDELQIEFERIERGFKKQSLLLALKVGIEDLRIPLDLKRVEKIITDAGLSETDADEIIGEIVWSTDITFDLPDSTRKYLVDSITKRLEADENEGH